MRRFIFHHRQHIVRVVVIEYHVSLGVLPHIKSIQRLTTDLALLKICVHFGFISAGNLVGISIMPFGFYAQLSERVGHFGKLEKFLTGFGISRAFIHENVQNVVATATTTETTKVECFLVVNEGSVILLMEGAATLHVFLIEIGNPQLFDDNLSVTISELFFGLQNCFSINLHG